MIWLRNKITLDLNGALLYGDLRVISHNFRPLHVLVEQKYARIQRGGGAGGTDPLKSRHHRPTSETPLKWHFAGGPLMARLEYLYGPPPPL